MVSLIPNLVSFGACSGIFINCGSQLFRLDLSRFNSSGSEVTLQTDILPERIHLTKLYLEATFPEDVQLDVVGQSDTVSQTAKLEFDTEGNSQILESPPRAIVSGQHFTFRLTGKGQSSLPNKVRQLWIAVLSGETVPARR